MSEPIVSIDRIEQQAREAAAKYSDINDAQPYPHYSAAGRAFKAEFIKTRLAGSVVAKPERGQGNATAKQVSA